MGTSIGDANDCTFIEEIEKEKGSLTNILPMTPEKFKGPEEWQAIGKINEQLMKSVTTYPVMDRRVVWDFNLKNKEWQISVAF